jgi:hypothetical protein
MSEQDKLFRKWYDERMGTKLESFAYDVWCAAWDAAQPKVKECKCDSPTWCELNDTCAHVSKEKGND